MCKLIWKQACLKLLFTRTRICAPQCSGEAAVLQHNGHPVGRARGAKWSGHGIQGEAIIELGRSNAIDMNSNYLTQCGKRRESIHYPLDLSSSWSALSVIPFDWSLMWNVLNVLTAARWILSDFTPDLTGSRERSRTHIIPVILLYIKYGQYFRYIWYAGSSLNWEWYLQVYFTTKPQLSLSQWESQFVDNNKLTTISDLTPHTIYTIRVEAYTSIGPGPLSTPVQVCFYYHGCLSPFKVQRRFNFQLS